jgi:hypothetical protein
MMPKTKETNVAKELALVTNVTAIKVTTIKKSFVKQMYGLTRKEFIKRIKHGTVRALGIAHFTDHPTCLILQTFEDERLVTYAEIDYREYLSHIGHFDHNLTGDDLPAFVEFELSKVPQLFTV